VVTDTDFLADRMWVLEQNVLGSLVYEDIANNGDFVINLADNLAGGFNLVSLRTRAVSSRPFERLEKIQRSAELRYHDKENQLQSDLAVLNQQLSQLQADNSGAGKKTLTAIQKADLAKFLEKKAAIRGELRQVQHQLNVDIDNLIGQIKLINILLMPGLVALFAFALGLRAMSKRRAIANN
jgi:ABC-type uncharacterized transport system involved in gliding motility auxiliary subunit